MTNIERFTAKQRFAQKFRQFADGMANPKNIDKVRLDVKITDFSTGTYGSSSVYSVDQRYTDAIERIIIDRIREIVQWAAEDAESEARQVAIEAAEEARAVLRTIGEGETT